MDKIRPQKWRQLLVFVCITSATLGFMMAIAESYSPKVASDLVSTPLGAFISRFIDLSGLLGRRIHPLYDPGTRTITLAVNESIELERVWITYRGLGDNNTFKIETIVPKFDREMAFRHQFDIEKAGKGFRLYLDQFELIDASAHLIRLRYANNALQ